MKIQFYFDYVSPNAYLAWYQIHMLLAGRDVEVEPVPILFSAILDAHGQRGPAEIPAKMQWMVKDVLRKAKRMKAPFNPPVSHPFNPLLALRVSSLALPASHKAALITAIFEAAWVQSIDVSNPTALAAALEAAGFESRSLIRQASSPEIKASLRTNTSAAVRSGVFGVPSMLVRDNLFWGFDDFANLEAFLNNEESLRPEEVSAWEDVHPSALRKKDF